MMGALNKGIRYEALTVGAALVLGVTAAVFRVSNAAALEPPPFRGPASVEISKVTAGNPVLSVNYPDWNSRNRVFGDLAAVVGMRRMNLTGAGEPQELVAGAVTANFFQRIGVRPIVGRAFLPGEDQRGREHVAILGHRLWRRRFGGDPHIVGKSIMLNGESHQVVGVLPPDFAWNNRRTDVWVPYVRGRDRDYRAAGREARPLLVVARYG
jgi:putative ABC transport system permease protein